MSFFGQFGVDMVRGGYREVFDGPLQDPAIWFMIVMFYVLFAAFAGGMVHAGVSDSAWYRRGFRTETMTGNALAAITAAAAIAWPVLMCAGIVMLVVCLLWEARRLVAIPLGAVELVRAAIPKRRAKPPIARMVKR